MTPRNRHFHAINHQQGMALVVGLVFLVLLTMLGLTGLGVATMEERMSGNSREQILAFNAAEASLRDCEALLDPSLPLTVVFQGVSGGAVNAAGIATVPTNPGMYQATAPGQMPLWEIDGIWNNANLVRVNATQPAGTFAAPRCIIEELPPTPDPGGSWSAPRNMGSDSGIFRVTARGVGRNANTVVMAQSTFRRPN